MPGRPTAPPRKWRSDVLRQQVRHVPIVVEAEESEEEVTYTGQTRLVTGGPVNIPIHYSWSIVYSDR